MNGSTEQEARTKIDLQLISKEWVFDGSNQNVYQERAKHKTEKDKLGRLRPDYILYDRDKPIAIIEAKKKDGDFNTAKKDGFKKSKLLGCYIVFVSDSEFTEAYDTKTDVRLYKNGTAVNSFIPLSELLKFEKTTEIEDETIIKTNQELQSIFKQGDGILRTCGIQPGMPRLSEIYNVLFIKMLSDIGADTLNVSNWQNLQQRQGEDLLSTFDKVVNNYNNNYNEVLKERNSSLSPEILKQIINLFDDKKVGNLSKVDRDIKGQAFEYFLKKYQDRHDDLAQYFTPRHIVKFLTWLAKPKFGDTVFDPFCGTGGMLIEAFKTIQDSLEKPTRENLNKLKNSTVWGQDNSESTRIAKMNMILAGDGHSNIQRKNTLTSKTDDKYDFVITNIPFNLKPNPAENNKKCIDFCIKSLKERGKAFIIVPYTIAENTYKDFRKKLEPILEKVIKLPSYTFQPYTPALAFILVINKQKENKYIEYIEITNDGFSKNKLRERTNDSDIERLQKGEIKFEHIPSFDSITSFQGGLKKGLALKTFLIPVNKTVTLQPNTSYHEPRITGKTNTISTKSCRLGVNIKADKKKLISKGDLVISTLHTQDGLFAIADKDYIGTSQLVYRIDEQKISKDVLFYILNKEIRKLKKDDVVKRETYKREEIENILLPPITKEVEIKIKERNKVIEKIQELEDRLKEIDK